MSRFISIPDNREFASEIKFLVPAPLGAAIREWARARLEADPHGGGGWGDTYLTTSIYFDTPCYDVYRRIHSFGRSKYRIRRYGMAEGAFLERKLKTRDLVSKRRTFVPLADLMRLESAGSERWKGFWFSRRLKLRNLHPVCQLSYIRTARGAMSAGDPIRLTLDQDLRTSPTAEIRFDPVCSATELLERRWILELKYRREVPALFQEMLAEFALGSHAVSKYRLAMEALRCPPPASHLSGQPVRPAVDLKRVICV